MPVLRLDRVYHLLFHCVSVQASLNGHPGMIVSGGSSSGNFSLTSVEFYNAKTGTWLQMPSMRKGRSGHAMTITRGKLMVSQDGLRLCFDILEYLKVAGGERSGRSGRQILDDVEIFTGKRLEVINVSSSILVLPGG